MCGIAGIVDKKARLNGEALASVARRMADAMKHRGPDDSGVWTSEDGRVSLSHRRLSIIDISSAGHQPMSSPDGHQQIVFNGEIYNFQLLREELEATGQKFRTKTDTEVLMRMLALRGKSCLNDLDAMFAFAFFDSVTDQMLLARDIFGEKPLYYLDNDDFFAFASEISVLTHVPDFDATIDGGTIARYLAYQYVPAPETIYRAVRKLPPGSVLSRDAQGSISVERYYRFEASSQAESERTLDDLADELEATLIESVRRRLVSDVPIGAFLSGGVDSSVVVALASRVVKQPVKTFTIGFEGFPESEHGEAAEAAKLLGCEHHERLVHPDGVALCEQIARLLDEPNADSSCLPTYLLSAFAREKVTVALSGDGGDEMFGGYGRYMATVDEGAKKRRDGGMEWWTPGTAYWSSRILVFPEEEVAALAGGIPATLARELGEARRSLDDDGRPLINALREIDAAHYMPGAVLAKVDRMSMQSSLEVRAPLIGRDVAAFAMQLAGDDCYGDGHGKRVLKHVAKRYLPAHWIDRPKRGFGLPMGLWGASALLPLARDVLLSNDARLVAWIPREQIASYLDRMTTNFSAYRAWSLIVLEIWLRNHPYAVGERLAPDLPFRIIAPRSFLRGIGHRIAKPFRRWAENASL